MKHSATPWIIAHKTNGVPLICHRPNPGPLNVIATMGPWNESANAKRIIDCVNALEGIEDPIKMRETWDVVKELELDAFHKLKEHHEGMKDQLKALFFEFCPYTPQQQELIDKLNRIIDEH